MQHYDVHRSFNVFKRGEVVELDPDDDGVKALRRDGYISPADGGAVFDFVPFEARDD